MMMMHFKSHWPSQHLTAGAAELGEILPGGGGETFQFSVQPPVGDTTVGLFCLSLLGLKRPALQIMGLFCSGKLARHSLKRCVYSGWNSFYGHLVLWHL